MPKVAKIMPQPALDAAAVDAVPFALTAPMSPEMCSLKMPKLRKRMNDPKAFVGAHSQKARLLKTWPLHKRKKNTRSLTMRKIKK